MKIINIEMQKYAPPFTFLFLKYLKCRFFSGSLALKGLLKDFFKHKPQHTSSISRTQSDKPYFSVDV